MERERSVHEASSNNLWADSGPTLVAQEAGNSSNCPDNGITLGNTVDLQPSLHVPVEHFGDFDTSETVFTGLTVTPFCHRLRTWKYRMH